MFSMHGGLLTNNFDTSDYCINRSHCSQFPSWWSARSLCLLPGGQAVTSMNFFLQITVLNKTSRKQQPLLAIIFNPFLGGHLQDVELHTICACRRCHELRSLGKTAIHKIVAYEKFCSWPRVFSKSRRVYQKEGKTVAWNFKLPYLLTLFSLGGGGACWAPADLNEL